MPCKQRRERGSDHGAGVDEPAPRANRADHEHEPASRVLQAPPRLQGAGEGHDSPGGSDAVGARAGGGASVAKSLARDDPPEDLTESKLPRHSIMAELAGREIVLTRLKEELYKNKLRF